MDVKNWIGQSTEKDNVNWCGLYEYGEEGLDWEVVRVPNKGLGIRGKRLLPVGFRIIVEPVFTDPGGHPAIMDLAPVGGILREKFLRHAIAGHPERDDGRPYIALRISRLNHNCRPNAANYSEEVAHVDVLYALWDIQPGEEICISYSSFSDLSKWGIRCAKDCYCKNPDAWAMVREGRKLGAEIKALADERKISEALRKGDQLLNIHRRLNESWLLRART